MAGLVVKPDVNETVMYNLPIGMRSNNIFIIRVIFSMLLKLFPNV